MISNLIQEIPKSSVELNPEILKVLKNIEPKPLILEEFVNLFFFKEKLVKRFDLEKKKIISINPGFELLSYVSICTSLNKVYMVGGTSISRFIPVSDVYELNLEKHSYRRLCGLKFPCYMPASVVLQDELFVIGGKSTKNQKLTCIQIINLITNSLRTIQIEECKGKVISTVAFQGNICYNSGDFDLKVIRPDCSPLNSFKVPEKYGKISALATFSKNLFILQETCIICKSENFHSILAINLSLEWMQQSPVIYKNILFLVDYDNSKIFKLNLTPEKFIPLETSSKEGSYFEDSNESSEKLVNNFPPSISLSSPNESLANLSSVQYT
jgi:hypothetical protein